MQCLTKKNTQLSQELEECKAQLEAALATSENVNGTPHVIYASKGTSILKCGRRATLTIIMQMRSE